MDMTKTAVKAALNIERDSQLASMLGVGRWAVGQWPADKPIPKARQWQLRAIRPDVFGSGLGAAPVATDADRTRVLIDSRMTKRALRARLGLQSDAHLAVVLKLPAGEVARWPEEGALPALPQIVALLGTQQPAAPAPPADPEDSRIVAVDTA